LPLSPCLELPIGWSTVYPVRENDRPGARERDTRTGGASPPADRRGQWPAMRMRPALTAPT